MLSVSPVVLGDRSAAAGVARRLSHAEWFGIGDGWFEGANKIEVEVELARRRGEARAQGSEGCGVVDRGVWQFAIIADVRILFRDRWSEIA
jgi:hypothetical protein